MDFTAIFSREQLQALPDNNRLDAIRRAVEYFSESIIRTAKSGQTSHIIDMDRIPKNRSGLKQFPPEYVVTVKDMMEGLQSKFPDCKVKYIETSHEIRAGLREQKKWISIDWS